MTADDCFGDDYIFDNDDDNDVNILNFGWWN